MMIYGTTGAFGFDDFPQPEVVGLYAAAGFEVVQAYRNPAKRLSARDILATLADLPVRVDSLHGIFGDDIDPSSEEESARRSTIDLYAREAEFCRELGGSLVVVHPCPANVEVRDLERKYGQLRRTFDELARVGERQGVRFAFENMPPYHPLGHDVERLAREVQAASCEQIVFLIDTGHAHMTGDLAAAVRAAGPAIAYTHVHDNDGKNDTHRLPLTGTIDWPAFGTALRNTRYKGVFLLEVFESPSDLRRLLTPDWTRRMRAALDGSP